MKLIIAGSRHIQIDDKRVGFEVVDRMLDYPTEIVCGMAKGVDEAGRRYAASIQVPVKEFPADWKKYGRSAGPRRNKQMAEYADALMPIWDGKSRGSASMLRCAQEAGIDICQLIVGVDL